MFKIFFLLSTFFAFSQNFLQPIFLNNTWKFEGYENAESNTYVNCPEDFTFLMNVYPESNQNYYWLLQICNNHVCFFNFNNVSDTELFYNFIGASSTLAICNIENPVVQNLDAILSNFFGFTPHNTLIQYTITFLGSSPTLLRIYKNQSTSLRFSNYSMNLPEETVPILYLYPNPTNDYIHWENSVKVDTLQILDLSGKKIYEVQNPQNIISIQHLNSGVYFVRMFFGENSTIQKLIKK